MIYFYSRRSQVCPLGQWFRVMGRSESKWLDQLCDGVKNRQVSVDEVALRVIFSNRN